MKLSYFKQSLLQPQTLYNSSVFGADRSRRRRGGRGATMWSNSNKKPRGPNPPAGASLPPHEPQWVGGHQDVRNRSGQTLQAGVVLCVQWKFAPVPQGQSFCLRPLQTALGSDALPTPASSGWRREHLRERRPRKRCPLWGQPRQRKVRGNSLYVW